MGIKNSKSDEAKKDTENIYVKYYCDNLLHQKVNIEPDKGDIESFTNVYNFRKQSLKKTLDNNKKNIT